MARHFSFRPSFTLRGREFYGIRGWAGKPIHPMFTDFPIVGYVLAATFTVLGVLPLVFLAEVGFAVAFGVLLDTIVVRSILVPALSYDIGKKIWWPSRLARADARD